MNVTLRQLHAFHAVSRLGSFVAAAKVLHVTPSALSNLVRELEDSLGFRLLERTTRRVELSEAGASYYESVERVLRAINDAKLRAEDLKSELTSTVRIAATQLVCWAVLPELLSAFRMQEPNVRVLVTDAKRSEIESLLKDQQVDLGILAGVHGNHELQTEVVLTADTCLACNPAHPLARNQRVSWTELADVSPMPGYVQSVLNPAQIVLVPIVEPSIENRVVLCTIEGRELSAAASIFRTFLLTHTTQKRDPQVPTAS
jgi:DNA-binding transcriptional LysR family regulator